MHLLTIVCDISYTNLGTGMVYASQPIRLLREEALRFKNGMSYRSVFDIDSCIMVTI